MEPRGYYQDPEDKPENDDYPVIPDEDPKPEPASEADLHALKAKVATLTDKVETIMSMVGTLDEQK